MRDGAIYGALSFAAGFVLGALREMMLIPAFGPAAGRLIEFPIVTLAAVATAWWLVRRTAGQRSPGRWLAAGLIGAATLLLLEGTLALGVLGMPIETYLAGFDIREGALFPIGLIVMAAAPAAISRILPSK